MDSPKIGMCGDGANDLLALKEADLSLGIQECDASYASSFTINSLLDVDEVIRESKNNVAAITQLFFYSVSGLIIAKIGSMILITNAADITTESVYASFASVLIYPLFISLSKPS